ncbi:MAG: hypothetical protein ACREXR_00010 [Gammaproteobacteria bacterium]
MRQSLYSYIFSVVVFIISYSLYPQYSEGDQTNYRMFYDVASLLPISDAFYVYQQLLGTSEPLYFLLTYALSGVLDKDFLFSFVNSMISYFVVSWMLKSRVSFLFLPLLLTNFYVLVLFFAAERLKIGVLFFLFAARAGQFNSYLFSALAIFSHLQMSVPAVILQIIRLQKDFLRLAQGFLTKKLFLSCFCIFVLALMAIPLLEHATGKLIFYMSASGGLAEILKPLVFLMLSVYYANDKFVAFLSSAQIVLLSLLVGSDRLVIFSYFLFMYYGLKVNRGVNFGVAVSSLYFSVKGIIFIQSVLECGEGFSCLAAS